MNHCTSFGEWIQLRCQALGLQSKQLADKVDYSLASIRKILRDEWRPRSGAERLAEVLCLDADERSLFLEVARGDRPVTTLPPPNLGGFTSDQEQVRDYILRPPCPYPGMLPFKTTMHASFFGRETAVQELVQRLALHPFVALIGPSGSGKSSLVAAGLIPALQRSGRFGAGAWLIRSMRPGAQPLTALATALEGNLAILENVVPHLLEQHHTQRLLLNVDQFEEIFTYGQTDAVAFQATIARLAMTARCYVVLTVRADFYSQLMSSPLWGAIAAHRFEVRPLGVNGLRKAIVRPAERLGITIEPALVERLVADAAGEPGALPFVQETLVLLWDQLEGNELRLSTYTDLVAGRRAERTADGRPLTGLHVALAHHADAALAALTPEQQGYTRRTCLRLIQFGEGRPDTRRQQSIAALRAAGDDTVQFDTTLRYLVDWRLLTTSGDAATPRVDLAHEALIDGWPKLRQWIQERREAEQGRRRLLEKATEWDRLGHGEAGLLDAVELVEAERWLASPDATDLGIDESVLALVEASRAALEAHAAAERARQQWEVAQAQALAEEQRQLAEIQVTASQRLRRRALYLAGALIVALIAMVSAVTFGIQAKQSAQQAARAAQLDRARYLAAEGQRVFSERPLLGLRLALEGWALTPPDERGTRTQLETIVTELAGQGRLLKLASDGEKVLTLSNGPMYVPVHAKRPSELRRMTDGSLVTQLSGHVDSISYGPNSSMLLVYYQGNIPPELRRVADGSLIAQLTSGRDYSPVGWSVEHVSFIVGYRKDGDGARIPVELRRATDGLLVREFANDITSITFSPDGSVYIAGYQGNKSAELRRTVDNALIAQLAGALANGYGNVVFSPDSTSFFVRYQDNKPAEIRHMANGSVTQLTNKAVWVNFSPDSKVFIVHYQNPEVIGPGGIVLRVGDLAAPPGELHRTADGTLITQLTGTLDIRIGDQSAGGFAFNLFSPDNACFFVKYRNNETGQSFGELRRTTDGSVIPLPGNINSVQFSRESRVLVVDYEGDRPDELRRTDGSLVAQLTSSIAGYTGNSIFSDPKGTLLLVRYQDNIPPELRRMADGTILARLPTGPFDWASPSHSGNMVAVSYRSGQYEIWQWHPTVHRIATFSFTSGAAFDSEDKRLIVTYITNATYLVDLDWLRKINTSPTRLSIDELAQMACKDLFASQLWTAEDQKDLDATLGERGTECVGKILSPP